MASKTIRLTTAEALVRFLIAQRTIVDGANVPLFPGVYGIFGHGNVTSLGHSLETHRQELPVWRGQNEQGMGLAAAAFAKAARRQQIMVCTSSTVPSSNVSAKLAAALRCPSANSTKPSATISCVQAGVRTDMSPPADKVMVL